MRSLNVAGREPLLARLCEAILTEFEHATSTNHLRGSCRIILHWHDRDSAAPKLHDILELADAMAGAATATAYRVAAQAGHPAFALACGVLATSPAMFDGLESRTTRNSTLGLHYSYRILLIEAHVNSEQPFAGRR